MCVMLQNQLVTLMLIFQNVLPCVLLIQRPPLRNQSFKRDERQHYINFLCNNFYRFKDGILTFFFSLSAQHMYRYLLTFLCKSMQINARSTLHKCTYILEPDICNARVIWPTDCILLPELVITEHKLLCKPKGVAL